MLPKNIILSNQRFISANATLSTVSTTEYSIVDSNDSVKTPPDLSTSLHKGTQNPSQQAKPDMNENTKVTIDEQTSMKNKPADNKPSIAPANKIPVSKLSIIAIALTVCLGGYLYFNVHQQAVSQRQTIAQLQSEITTLKQTLQQSITEDIKLQVSDTINQQNKQFAALDQKVKNQLNTQVQSQQQFITKVDDAIKVSEQNLFNFNERLSAMSTTDNNTWLISQANYLVNLAGRKIWNDQDYTTARLLLKNADSSLAQANDPSLLPARQAINKDISALAAISFTDFDGIVMSLMNLADFVTELPLVDHYQEIDLGMTNHDDSIVETEENTDELVSSPQMTSPLTTATSHETSSSIADWYDNLRKGTESFFTKFIQIEKYDRFGECIADAGQDQELLKKCQTYTAIIMPEQALYLRENIKLRLFIAAQAVPRHQELIYQQALNDVSIWANAYFDHNATSVKSFLSELANLQQQTISNQNVPQKLSSHDELDKLMQVRVRAMLAN